MRRLRGQECNFLASVYKDKLSAPYFKEIMKKNNTRSVLDVFKEEVLSDYMYVNNVISSDGETTAIIATVAKGSPESRMKLVKETREIIRTAGIETENESSQSLLKKGMVGVKRSPKDYFLAGHLS